MPLTTSHPAAALPLAWLTRGALPLTALVVGTMAPDLEYLVRGVAVGRFGHTLTGLVLLCVPASVLALLLVGRLLRPAAAAVLPRPIAARLRVTPSWARWPGLVAPRTLAAIVLGALSHDLWDSVTHLDGWVAGYLFFVHQPVRPEPGYRPGDPFCSIPSVYYWYQLLQDASTVLGAIVTVLWMARARVRHGAAWSPWAPAARRRAVAAAAVMLLASVLGVLLNGHPLGAWRAPLDFGRGAIGAMDGALLGAILSAVVLRLTVRRTPTVARAERAPRAA